MTRLFDDDATVAAFRAALPECTLLHVSAHGRLDPDDSFEAGIDLADGRFTLRDLAASRADAGRLAVLLACESASGDFEAPDEALHAAGAAQQAGFAEVVAATLPVRDSSVVPFVTRLYAAVAAEPTDGAWDLCAGRGAGRGWHGRCAASGASVRGGSLVMGTLRTLQRPWPLSQRPRAVGRTSQ